MTQLLHRLTMLLTAPLVLSVSAVSCSTDDEGRQAGLGYPYASQYINISITISSGQHPATRAGEQPQGSEDGNGREAGYERENQVDDITLILADKPLADNTARVAFIRTFAVSRTSTQTTGTDRSPHREEAQYSTGNQLVSPTELDMMQDKTYYALVVANCEVTTRVGDPVATVLRDVTVGASQLFSGTGSTPDVCTHFAMSSEQEAVINFTNTSLVDITSEPNAVYFSVINPIVIERMAARLDFSTTYSGGNAAYGTYSVSDGGTPATVSGFKYDTDLLGNYFILESIVPFNMNAATEYLFKRVVTAWPSGDVTYLGDETTTNFVADPNTTIKDPDAASPLVTATSYANALPAGPAPDWSANTHRRTATSLNAQASQSAADHSYVVAYLMENTLLPASPLTSYATGLAITGSYYDSGHHLRARKTFYGYLRHQGESSSAYRACEWAGLDPDATVGSTPMNFGVVRNNIYQVAIQSIDFTGGWLQLSLTVHDWRHVEHPTIYI